MVAEAANRVEGSLRPVAASAHEKAKKKILIKRLKYRNEEDGEGKGSGFVFFFDCVIIQ